MTGTPPWTSTAVTRVDDGRYAADIAPAWQLAMVPQGGVLAAIAARAMTTELGTGQPLRSFHGVFASPVPVGEVHVDVAVLRAGRSISQVAATVHPVGASAGFSAIAAFGDRRPGFAYTELAMPDVAPPHECVSYRDPPPPEAGMPDGPRFAFWDEVLEGRPARGHAPWDDAARDAAEVVTWFRFEETPTDADGGFDPLAMLVAADMMPSAVFEKVGRDERGWFAPSVDLTVHLRAVPSTPWLLNHNRAHFATDGYASAECALWDPYAPGGPALLAWATQLMFFTRFD